MVSWLRAGYAGGFRRAVGPGTEPIRAAYASDAYRLSSPGTVDLNGITRQQFYVVDYSDLMVGNALFRFVAADFTAYPGEQLGATAFLAPASAFAVDEVPTPSEIAAAATKIVGGRNAAGGGGGVTGDRLSAPGDIELSFYSPALPWEPNTKWWYLIAPVHVGFSGAINEPMSDVNVLGRAISLWTNRTPSAPVILAPSGQKTVRPGTSMDFVFSAKDPDRIGSFTGDIGPTDFNDVAGVQVQYAPVPTDAVPTPAWADLPIADSTGTAVGRGWHMDLAPTSGGNDGARSLWLTSKMTLRCGYQTLAPNVGLLPSGDWQIRVRTFDYGHPLPDGTGTSPYPSEPPLTDATHSYTPANYPAVNTSPWSTPALVSVSVRVPPPVPISPIENRAIIEGTDVTLTWQYRNTYVPPFAQAKRTVQIRQVGDPVWTTLLFEDASASAEYEVTGFGFVSGNQYEWRVRAEDAGGSLSEFSEPARFWLVPAPGSGGGIPSPGETIDGATLGCGTHRVVIYRRGGTDRTGEIKFCSKIEWNRVRDDISTAQIDVSGWDIDCGELLASLQAWAYEVVIFRDNGYGSDRVWEGPITLMTYEKDKVTIHAKDVMAYAYRRIMRQAMSDRAEGDTVTSRAARILLNAFAPDDPNVLANMQPLYQEDDARQYRSTPAYSRTAFEEIDDMAANAGLDYTAVGRAILIWGTKHRIGTLPEFRDKDLGNSPIVSEYGMSMANVYVVSDGNGIYGEATRLNEDGQDPTYGIVEVLSSTWSSDSAQDTGTYTQEGVATIKASFAAAAERSIADRYPPPVVVRVPDNTRLNPDVVLSIQHLVPGVVVPLRSTSTLRTVVANQKLDSIKVVEEAGIETVTITLSPFSRDDVEIEAEVG